MGSIPIRVDKDAVIKPAITPKSAAHRKATIGFMPMATKAPYAHPPKATLPSHVRSVIRITDNERYTLNPINAKITDREYALMQLSIFIS
jgi:hypothetical protein